MKKTIYLISGLLLIVVIIIVFLTFSSRKQPGSQQVIETPTSVPIPTNNNTPLKITSSIPTDKQISIPVNQIITVTFNQSITKKDISFSIQPSNQNAVNTANNQLTINFLSPLKANTVYTYTISYKGSHLYQSTFTTTGEESLTTNDNTAQTMKIWTRANRPDLFLNNQAPYATSDFSMTSDITTTEPYHYFFNVSLTGSNKDQSQQEFINWMLSLGLTNDQIQTLDIRYQ